MNLIGTSILSSLAVASRLGAMLVINKILAVYVGPSGYALIGQFQNALTGLTAVASAGVGVGVTKYTAEYNTDLKKQHLVWSTAAICCAIGSCALAMIIYLFNIQISEHFLKSANYTWPVISIAICLPFLVFNALLLAILNGQKLIKIFVVANILNSISSVLAVYIGAWLFGLIGALISLTIGQTIAFLLILLFTRDQWFKTGIRWQIYDNRIAKELSHFTLIAITTSIIGPATQIVIRNHLIDTLGIDSAGYWEAMMRVSGGLIMLISTPLSVYYLPHLAELIDRKQIRSEIVKAYKHLMPTLLVVTAFLYFFREIIIVTLFSEKFLDIEALFKAQLLGDVFRMAAWLLSFYMLAKAMTRQFIIVEIVFNLSYVAFSWLGINEIGLNGVSVAYAVNNLLYLFAMIYIVNKALKI